MLEFVALGGAVLASVATPDFSHTNTADRMASAQAATAPDTTGETIALSLEQALALARRRNTAVDRSRRNVEIASLLVRNARASYSPSASVTVSANQSARGSAFRAEDVVFRQGIEGNFLGGASLQTNLPIDVSGIIGRQVRQARIGEEVAEVQLRDAEATAVADVHIAYLTALRAQQVAEIDEQVVGAIELLLARAATRASAVVPFLNLELAAARQVSSGSRSAAEVSQDSLKQVLALSLDIRLDLTSALERPRPDPTVAAMQGTLGNRADIQAGEQRVRQSELSVVQAGDGRRPTVSVGGYLSQYFGGQFVSDTGRTSNRDYGLNLAVRLPILNYDAGRSDNSVRIAALRAEQARADLDDQRRRAQVEVRQLRSAYGRAMRRLDALPDAAAAAQALAAAERALLAAPEERQAGLLAQVSNARAAWRSAQAASVDAYVEGNVAAIRLRRSIGLS